MNFLAFSLSVRKESYNRKLIKLVEQIFQANSMKIEILDLLEYDMPSYNEDVQNNKGFPEGAECFKEKLATANGLILATPEYNYSYPGYFKNMFDWISRYKPMPWNNKSVLLLSASPSLVGGERALLPLKVPFEGCGSFVFPKTFSLASSYQAFNEKNELIDQRKANTLSDLILSFIKFTKALQ